MTNMSYCRFENTLRDLRDCEEALETLLNDPLSAPLSERELSAAKSMVVRCAAIVSTVLEFGPDTEDRQALRRSLGALREPTSRTLDQVNATLETRRTQAGLRSTEAV